MQFGRSLVPIITPFNRKGNIDVKPLEKFIEWQIAEGTDGIVCCGTTGESPALSNREKKKIAEICIRVAAKRIPIIVGTGVSDTKTTVQLTEQMQKLGADGCLVVTPYYNRPTQRGCVLHYQEVAKVGLPMIAYHNPVRAGVRLEAETILEMSRIPGVIAMKDSGRDFELIRKVHKSMPILSGDDDLTFQILQAGGVGAISAVGNVIPRGCKKMIDLCLDGKWEEGKVLVDKYLPLCKAVFLETNPQCFKLVLSWFGKCKPILRLPLVLPTEKTEKELKKVLISLALQQFHSTKSLGASL